MVQERTDLPKFSAKHKSGNTQSYRERKALPKNNFYISTKVCFVQYLELLSEEHNDSDGVHKALGCTRVELRRTPGVVKNLSPGSVYGLLPTGSIKSVVHKALTRRVRASCTKSSKVKWGLVADTVILTGFMMCFTQIGSTFAETSRTPFIIVFVKELYSFE